MNRNSNCEATFLPQIVCIVLAGFTLLLAGCTTSQTTHEAVVVPAAAAIQEKATGEATNPQGPAATIIRNYLAAAASLDAGATRNFLAANCKDDIVTECQANAAGGWPLDTQDTTIVSEIVDTAGGKATVKAKLSFKGGSPGHFTWMMDSAPRTFFLVLENGVWKISGMDPKPRQATPGVRPLSP